MSEIGVWEEHQEAVLPLLPLAGERRHHPPPGHPTGPPCGGCLCLRLHVDVLLQQGLSRVAGQTSENNSNILFSQFRFQKFWRQILPLFDRKSPDLLEVIRYYNQERRRILIMTVHGRLQLRIDNFSFIFNFSVQES